MSIFTARPARVHLAGSQDHDLYGLFSFAPPKIDAKARAPLNLSLILDRSGSMEGEKMDFVRKSVVKLLELLEPTDRVSIILFNDYVHDLAEPTLVTMDARRELIQRVLGVWASGGTNLSGGLLQGLSVTQKHVTSEGVSRAMLFTDGQANVGVLDTAGIVKIALEMRGSVGISTFGYGDGYNAELLAQLAQNASGGTYYIDSPDRILTAFGTELGGLISTFGQNVEVRLKPNEGVTIVEVLNDVDVSGPDADGHFVVKCEDLLADHPVHLAVRLAVTKRDQIFPRDVSLVHAIARFINLPAAKADEATTALKVRFVKDSEADATDDKDVMAEVALHRVVAAQAIAIKLANAGDFAQASSVLRCCAEAVEADSADAAAMARGTVNYVSNESVFQRGGGKQYSYASNNVIRTRRSGMKGMSLGGVQLDSFASPQQTATADLFNAPPAPVPLIEQVVPPTVAPAPEPPKPSSPTKSRSRSKW